MTSVDTGAIFKAYDVRGTYPDQLDEVIARAVGAAFARFARSPRLVIARDMRQSGVSLSAAFSDGARGEGVEVVDLGLASTDLLYFASGFLDAPGAMFTGWRAGPSTCGSTTCARVTWQSRPLSRETRCHMRRRLTGQ